MENEKIPAERSLGVTNLWRHPALLFDVVGTDSGAQELSPSKPIPANTMALVRGPGRQHISLAMRLNKHTRDAL
jgi:hypothetical protein